MNKTFPSFVVPSLCGPAGLTKVLPDCNVQKKRLSSQELKEGTEIQCHKTIYNARNKMPEVIAGIVENEIIYFENLHPGYEYIRQEMKWDGTGGAHIIFTLKKVK